MSIKAKGLVWVGIGTDHYAENMRLFTGVLGLEVIAQGDEQAILKTANGDQVELFGKDGRGKSQNMPPTIAFEVENVRAARDALAAAGVQIVGEIGEWKGHEWQYFRTADGHLFEIKRSFPVS